MDFSSLLLRDHEYFRIPLANRLFGRKKKSETKPGVDETKGKTLTQKEEVNFKHFLKLTELFGCGYETKR